MDRISADRRSANMRAIRGKDTAPELTVRRMVHGMGYRYRLHVAGLPGKPDLVFASRRKVIFESAVGHSAQSRWCWHQQSKVF